MHTSTVTNWVERSACNSESTGLALIWDSYCLGTLSKSLTHSCSAIPLHLRCRGVCTLKLCMLMEVLRYQRQLYCIHTCRLA